MTTDAQQEMMDRATEWRPVVGFEESHEVSDTGLVRSIGRWIRYRGGDDRWREGRLSITAPNEAGRRPVFISHNGRGRRTYVYRLVAEAFIPNPEGKREVNHLDGNPSNDHVSNLEWSTRLENLAHAHRLGLCGGARNGFANVRRGERHYLAKLRDRDVREMRHLWPTDRPAAYRIAARRGVSEASAWAAATGRTWRHIDA